MSSCEAKSASSMIGGEGRAMKMLKQPEFEGIEHKLETAECQSFDF